MSDDIPDKNLDTEADVYIKIGKLLQKNRSPEAQDRVYGVVNSEIGMDEKIKKIHEIDSSDKLEKTEPSGSAGEEVSEILSKYDITTEEKANKNINYIKKQIYKKSFFRFIFKEYFRIKNYAKDSPVLRLSAFSVRLNVRKYLLLSLQKEAALLINFINPVLEIGWTVLTKFEYNLLVQFRKLCEDISRTDMTYNNNEIQFLAKIKNIESGFFICNFKTEYPGIIIRCMTNIMKNQLRLDSNADHAEILIKKILLPANDPHSLYHLIIGLNIVIYRTYFRLEDLVQSTIGGVINNFNFDCSDAVESKINGFIVDNEKTLKDLLMQKADISKVNHFLKEFIKKNKNGKDDYNFGLLVAFYESGSGLDKFFYHRDIENLLIFTNNLMIRFYKEFEPFFSGRTRLDNWGELLIFTSDFFYFELSRLKTESSQLSKMAVAAVQISVGRYKELRRSSESADSTKDEVLAIQIVDELSNLMVDLGKKTGQLYQIYRPENTNDAESKKDSDGSEYAGFKPLDPSILVKNSYTVPFWNEKMKIPGILFDKSFGEAVHTITSICLLIGAYFSSSKLMSSIEKETDVINGIHKVKSDLERVADVVTFEKIKKIYRL